MLLFRIGSFIGVFINIKLLTLISVLALNAFASNSAFAGSYTVQLKEFCSFEIDGSPKHLITYFRNDGYRFTNAQVTDAIYGEEALYGNNRMHWYANHYAQNVYSSSRSISRLRDKLNVIKFDCKNKDSETCPANIQNISIDQDGSGRIVETVVEEFKNATCKVWSHVFDIGPTYTVETN